MIQTLNGDMANMADEIEDSTVDLLLTDPPYNISNRGASPSWIKDGKEQNTVHDQKFDDTFEDEWDTHTHEEFLEQLDLWSTVWFSKLRKGATFAIFISDVYISHLWTAMEKVGFEPKRIIVWKKPSAVPFNRKVNPVSGCEYILWGIKPGGKRTFNAHAPENSTIEKYSTADKMSSILYRNIKDYKGKKSLPEIFQIALAESTKVYNNLKRDDDGIKCVIPNTITFSNNVRDRIHPTEKPVELLEYLIKLCSSEGDLVLDTFAGSGSTGIASYNTSREYILIERDPKMYQSMKNRIDTHTSSPANVLFNIKSS